MSSRLRKRVEEIAKTLPPHLCARCGEDVARARGMSDGALDEEIERG